MAGSEKLDELSTAWSHGLPQDTAQPIVPKSPHPHFRTKRQKIYVSLEWRKVGGEKVNTGRAHRAVRLGEEEFPQPLLLSNLTKDNLTPPGFQLSEMSPDKGLGPSP